MCFFFSIVFGISFRLSEFSHKHTRIQIYKDIWLLFILAAANHIFMRLSKKIFDEIHFQIVCVCSIFFCLHHSCSVSFWYSLLLFLLLSDSHLLFAHPDVGMYAGVCSKYTYHADDDYITHCRIYSSIIIKIKFTLTIYNFCLSLSSPSTYSRCIESISLYHYKFRAFLFHLIQRHSYNLRYYHIAYSTWDPRFT